MELKETSGESFAVLTAEFVFTYGMFGYGESFQVELRFVFLVQKSVWYNFCIIVTPSCKETRPLSASFDVPANPAPWEPHWCKWVCCLWCFYSVCVWLLTLIYIIYIYSSYNNSYFVVHTMILDSYHSAVCLSLCHSINHRSFLSSKEQLHVCKVVPLEFLLLIVKKLK